MLSIGIKELKAKLAKYVRAARGGETVLVTDRGEVVAVRTANDLELLLNRVEIVEISAQVAELAERIAPDSTLRSLDAIHLASWHLLRRADPAIGFLTADRRLAAAAGLDPVEL